MRQLKASVYFVHFVIFFTYKPEGKRPGMPYKTNQDLPESIRHVLPAHAQDIYREVFNHAWQTYANPQDRRDDATQEETARKVAWAAVKKKYQKAGEAWVAIKE